MERDLFKELAEFKEFNNVKCTKCNKSVPKNINTLVSTLVLQRVWTNLSV